MSRSTIMRIITALCTMMLLVSSCAIASAEYAHSVVIEMPAGKMAYGPSTDYQKRPADTTSSEWRCYLAQIVYLDCGCDYPYDEGGISVYLYCRNKVRNCVASDTFPTSVLGGYGDDRDAHPFRAGVPLSNKLAEYKVVAVRNNCGAVPSEDEIALRFSWQPY